MVLHRDLSPTNETTISAIFAFFKIKSDLFEIEQDDGQVAFAYILSG